MAAIKVFFNENAKVLVFGQWQVVRKAILVGFNPGFSQRKWHQHGERARLVVHLHGLGFRESLGGFGAACQRVGQALGGTEAKVYGPFYTAFLGEFV